jgi:UPF0716 protein FxsA
MNPLLIILFIFVGAPLAELYVLIEVGSEIGAIPTIALSILTAVLGGLLVRVQGFSVLMRAQQQMEQNSAPAIELMEGAALLIVGIALLLPGFITDAIGFLLLITPVRRGFILWWLRSRGVMQPGTRVDPEDPSQTYIEGEYKRDDEH